jgi:hypothetical protein
VNSGTKDSGNIVTFVFSSTLLGGFVSRQAYVNAIERVKEKRNVTCLARQCCVILRST